MTKLEMPEIAARFRYELGFIIRLAQMREDERRAFLEDQVEQERLITGGWVSAGINCGRDEDILEEACGFFIADILDEVEDFFEDK